MIDDAGFITAPPRGPLQPEFRGLVEEVVNRLTLRLGDALHSIYLYGSVAQGRALPGVSDLDVCLILKRPPTGAENDIIAGVNQRCARYPEAVCKIDTDVGTLADALAPENLYSWGYWLRHHCRCVYGEDLGKRFPRFRPSRAIAEALNGDVFTVLESYIAALNKVEDGPPRRLLRRAAARRLVRATNMLRGDNDADWPDTLEEYVDRFRRRYPSRAADIDYFLRESRYPGEDTRDFITRLRQFMTWLGGCCTNLRYNPAPQSLTDSDPQ